MSKKFKFELNLKGLNELMKSPEMQTVLEQAGQTVAANAGSDYATDTHVADFVAITNVYPTSREAAKDNYENNTLLKATGSAGLSSTK